MAQSLKMMHYAHFDTLIHFCSVHSHIKMRQKKIPNVLKQNPKKMTTKNWIDIFSNCNTDDLVGPELWK
jgi:hypothetical protein